MKLDSSRFPLTANHLPFLKKKDGRVERKLRKAKAFFKSEDNVVSNWNHILEDLNGTELDFDVDNLKRYKLTGLRCRACLVGGIFMVTEPEKVYKATARVASSLIEDIAKHSFHGVNTKYSVEEAHQVYDEAIAVAHELGI